METKLCFQGRPLAYLGENTRGRRTQSNRRVQLIANGARVISLMKGSPIRRRGTHV